MPNPSPPPPPKKKAGRLRALARRIRDVLAIVGGGVIVYHLFFNVSRVVSPSMAPTLRGTTATNGDWVLTETLTYRLRKPHRWELVQFYDEEGVVVMKRVVGLPGETISLRDGRPVIDGTLIQPPATLQFLHYYAFGPYSHGGKETACGDGYFLLGDDSKDSQDSRYEGPLSPERLNGRPWLIVSPWGRAGLVNP